MKIKVDNSPLVTVILPVYNCEKYLSQSIESIINQTYHNIEIIIINDGSSDCSIDIINKFKNIDNRIIIVSRENKGLIYSLNQGISIARGKYICRMDSDDIAMPDRVFKQVNFMELNPHIGVCGSWAELFGENVSNRILKHPPSNERMKPELLFSVCFIHPSTIIRKSIMIDNGILYDSNFRSVEDYHLWVVLSDLTEYHNLPEVLLKYRYVAESVSRVADREPFGNRFENVKKIFSIQLHKIGKYNSDTENILHFIVASNDRLERFKIDLHELNIYFKKSICRFF